MSKNAGNCSVINTLTEFVFLSAELGLEITTKIILKCFSAGCVKQLVAFYNWMEQDGAGWSWMEQKNAR